MTFTPVNFGHSAHIAAQIAITTLLLFALFFLMDWDLLWDTLAVVRLKFLLGAFLCLLAILLIGALNIWILLDSVAAISFTTTLRVYLESWCTFLLLPGSAGDAVQIIILKQAGISYEDSGAVYITDKAASLAAAMAVGIIGGLFYFRPFLRFSVLLGIAAILGLIVAAAYKVAQRSGKLWISRTLNFVGAPVRFYQSKPKRVRVNALGTLTKLAITGLSHWLTFQAVGAEVSFGVVLTVAVLAGLVAYVPIAFNGLGTVEFAAVTLYGVSNVAAHLVIATYLLLRTSNVVVAVLAMILSRFLISRPIVRLSDRG